MIIIMILFMIVPVQVARTQILLCKFKLVLIVIDEHQTRITMQSTIFYPYPMCNKLWRSPYPWCNMRVTIFTVKCGEVLIRGAICE